MALEIACPECGHCGPLDAKRKDLYRCHIISCPNCRTRVSVQMVRRKHGHPRLEIQTVPPESRIIRV